MSRISWETHQNILSTLKKNSPPSEKVSHNKLVMNGNMEEVEVEESPQEESSVEGKEDSDDGIEGGDEDEEVNNVP